MPVRLTDESRAAWRQFARAQHVTVTSLIETLGPCLNEAGRLPPWLGEAIEQARTLDAERRGR